MDSEKWPEIWACGLLSYAGLFPNVGANEVLYCRRRLSLVAIGYWICNDRAFVYGNYLGFFFFHLFFFTLDLFGLLGTKSACRASYGIKEPPITDQPAPGKKPSIQVPLVCDKPHTSYAK